MMSDIEKLHTLVTRPAETVIESDDDGRVNISPLAFPVRNNSGFTGCKDDGTCPENNPVLAVPEFSVNNSVIRSNYDGVGSLAFSCHADVAEVRSETLNCIQIPVRKAVVEHVVVDEVDYGTKLVIYVDGDMCCNTETDWAYAASIQPYRNRDGQYGPVTITEYKESLGYDPNDETKKRAALAELRKICPVLDNKTKLSISRAGRDQLEALADLFYVEFNPWNLDYVEYGKDDDPTPVPDHADGYTVIYANLPAETVESLGVKYVDSGKLFLNVTITLSGGDSKSYFMLDRESEAGNNGVYRMSCSADGTMMWDRISALPSTGVPVEEFDDASQYPYSDPSVNDNVAGCYNDDSLNHYRKGYSDREVMEYVEDKLQQVLSFATHSPFYYDFGNCGAFLRWVLDCNTMDITGGYLSHPIYVDTFGMGAYYSGICDPGTNEYTGNDDYDDYSHPVLEWGYGTRWNSVDNTGMGLPVLPRDWPFRHVSEYTTGQYDARIINNNITLTPNGVYRRSNEGTVITEEISAGVKTGGVPVYDADHNFVSCERDGGKLVQKRDESGNLVYNPITGEAVMTRNGGEQEYVDIIIPAYNVDETGAVILYNFNEVDADGYPVPAYAPEYERDEDGNIKVDDDGYPTQISDRSYDSEGRTIYLETVPANEIHRNRVPGTTSKYYEFYYVRNSGSGEAQFTVTCCPMAPTSAESAYTLNIPRNITVSTVVEGRTIYTTETIIETLPGTIIQVPAYEAKTAGYLVWDTKDETDPLSGKTTTVPYIRYRVLDGETAYLQHCARNNIEPERDAEGNAIVPDSYADDIRSASGVRQYMYEKLVGSSEYDIHVDQVTHDVTYVIGEVTTGGAWNSAFYQDYETDQYGVIVTEQDAEGNVHWKLGKKYGLDASKTILYEIDQTTYKRYWKTSGGNRIPRLDGGDMVTDEDLYPIILRDGGEPAVIKGTDGNWHVKQNADGTTVYDGGVEAVLKVPVRTTDEIGFTGDRFGRLKYDLVTDDEEHPFHLWYDRHHFTFYNDFAEICYDAGSPASNPTEDGETLPVYADLKKTTTYPNHMTAIKPAFIHLATPIDLNDGDEYEITVSLVDINTDKAFSGANPVADLSGYYNFISRPRVYILSGTQEFATGRYYMYGESIQYVKVVNNVIYSGNVHGDPITAEEAEGFVFRTKGALTHATGDLIDEGNVIRFNLLTQHTSPTETTFRGKVVENKKGSHALVRVLYGTVDENEHPIANPAKTNYALLYKNKAKFPFDIYSRDWAQIQRELSICSIAYLNDVMYDNFGAQKLGLISRTKEILGTEYDTDSIFEHGKMNEFNRFYTMDGTKGGTEMPSGDNHDFRYIVASVYPTATNTFPWALSNRKKLSHMDVLMTGAADTTMASLIGTAWEANRALLAEFPIMSAYKRNGVLRNGIYNLDATDCPVSYSATYRNYSKGGKASVIGSTLRVALGSTVMECDCSDEGQPVRQARKAYLELLNDLFMTRCGHGSEKDYKKAVTGPNAIGVGMEDRELPTAGEQVILSNAQDEFNRLPCKENLGDAGTRMFDLGFRHVPAYVRDAYHVSGRSGDADEDWEPFNGTNLSGTYSATGSYTPSVTETETGMTSDALQNALDTYCKEYSNYSLYGDYDTIVSSAEVPCSLYGDPGTGASFAIRSVIDHVLRGRYVTKGNETEFTDMLRFAESQRTWLAGMHDIAVRYTYKDEVEFWKEPWTPFTKIFSIDDIPLPHLSESTVESLGDEQKVFVSGDAVQMYRLNGGYADLGSIASVMDLEPAESVSEYGLAVTRYLERYVPEYASNLPMRFYKGSRIYLADGKIAAGTVFDKAVRWMAQMFDGCGDLVNRYLNDTFMAGTKKYDSNMDDLLLPAGRGVEINASAPPYTVYAGEGSDDAGSYYNRFGVRPTYTRVYMKFTFSGANGRWYCTDYRQVPTTYLTPLYGADALGQKVPVIKDINGNPATLRTDANGNVTSTMDDYLWRNSGCVIGNTYLSGIYAKYSETPPMDMNVRAVPFLYDKFPFDPKNKWKLRSENCNSYDDPKHSRLSRLERPWLSWEEGGIGLYPPANVNGGAAAADMSKPGYAEKYASAYVQTNDGMHANIWNVREYIRPATCALKGTDVPSYDWCVDDGEVEREGSKTAQLGFGARIGGIFSDATMYRMFATPRQDMIVYHTPNELDPAFDPTDTELVWHPQGSERPDDEDYAIQSRVPFNKESEYPRTVYSMAWRHSDIPRSTTT